jgi:homoserine dehydrogenase
MPAIFRCHSRQRKTAGFYAILARDAMIEQRESSMSIEVSIIQIGLGGVGRALARQVLAQQEAIVQRYGVKLQYRAIADSSGLLAGSSLLGSATVQAALASKQAGGRLADLPGASQESWQATLTDARSIVVDVSAAPRMEGPLADVLSDRQRVVLANKLPLTESLPAFKALTAGGRTRYEATVGAGLPIIAALQSLLDSGDRIQRIEASMSGTLGYLCGAIEQQQAFSTAVRHARAQGWTEPDPRDDLSGADVARKALILGRTCGLAWGANSIAGEPWYPPALSAVGVDEFMQRLDDLDQEFAERVEESRSRGAVLRYIATIEAEGVAVGLREVPFDHPLATLRGTDNLFSFTTERYIEQSLVIRGPGAGVDVTAAGVLADIIATARELGRE